MTETKKIYSAIAAMIAEVDAIGKDKRNQQQGFNYRGIDDVMNALHPLLAKHKVFPTCEVLSRDVTERATKTGGVLFYVNMRLRYTFWAEDGSSVTTEAWGEAMDSGDKASNKCMSVGYKYAMFQLLCIPTEAVDPDSQVHHDVLPATQPKSAAKTTTKLMTESSAVEKAKNMTIDERYAAAKRHIEVVSKDAKKSSGQRLQKLDDTETSVRNHPDFDGDQKTILLAMIDKARESLREPATA
jgi:hypothetical protein